MIVTLKHFLSMNESFFLTLPEYTSLVYHTFCSASPFQQQLRLVAWSCLSLTSGSAAWNSYSPPGCCSPLLQRVRHNRSYLAAGGTERLQPATLLCPWDFLAGILEWLPLSSRDLPHSGTEPVSPVFCSAGRFFTCCHQGSLRNSSHYQYKGVREDGKKA